MPYPLWKSVLAREGDGCLGPLLSQGSVPMELVRHGSINPGADQAVWMRLLVGQGTRGRALLERLVRKA